MALLVTARSVVSTGPRTLIAEEITPGTVIDTWRPGEADTVRRRLEALSTPYVVDEDGDLVVEVRHPDGHTSTELASDLGLCGDRYTGKWRAIAVRAS